jgi:hypothetical protein
VNVGSDSRGNVVGVANADIDAYAKEKGISHDEAAARIRQAVAQTNQPSAVKAAAENLPVGAPCRVDLIRPMNKGAAYEGTIVRATKDEIVLCNAILEAPANRSTVPVLKDLPLVGDKYFGNDGGIVRTNVAEKEVRIARAEVASLRLLDQRPKPPSFER